MNANHDNEDRLNVEVTPRCHARATAPRGHAPELTIDYGGYLLVFTAGAHAQDAHIAKEFAIELASAALAFAGACNRLLPARPYPPTPPEGDQESPWPA